MRTLTHVVASVLLCLLAVPAAAEIAVAVFPIDVPEGVEVESALKTAIASAEGVRRVDTAELKDILGDRFEACRNTIECTAEVTGALGADLVVGGKATVDGGRISVNLRLSATDPFEVVQEFKHSEAAVGVDAQAGVVGRAVRFLLNNVAPAAGDGKLSVNAPIEGAEVLLDGTAIGVTPVVEYATTAGVHRVEVTSGDSSFSALVEILADDTLVIDAPVAPAPAAGGGNILAWSAVGSGVVLAVVGTAALGYSFLESGRLNDEIKQANQNGGFDGEDDPDLVRIREETLTTHLVTGGGVVALLAGATLTTLGATLLFTGE